MGDRTPRVLERRRLSEAGCCCCWCCPSSSPPTSLTCKINRVVGHSLEHLLSTAQFSSFPPISIGLRTKCVRVWGGGQNRTDRHAFFPEKGETLLFWTTQMVSPSFPHFLSSAKVLTLGPFLRGGRNFYFASFFLSFPTAFCFFFPRGEIKVCSF